MESVKNVVVRQRSVEGRSKGRGNGNAVEGESGVCKRGFVFESTFTVTT